MEQATSGFVLAAGEGRRLRPLIGQRAKALAPVCGIPLLELACSYLSLFSVTTLIVNTWAQKKQVVAACGKIARKYHLRLRLSPEEQLSGTGGGLRKGVTLVPESSHFLVHNVDIILDYDLSVLLQRHFEEKADATLLLVPGTGPLTVDTDSRNLIVSLTRPAGKGKYTFSGVHILRRDILDFLPATEPCSIITAYEKAIQAGLKVIGLSVEKSFWADTGTPTDYLNVHARIADAGLRYHRLLQQAQLEQARRRATLERSGVWCSGAIGLGKNIRVVPGTQLHNIVIWDNSRITRPFFYTQGVFTRTLQPTRVPWNKRKPDSRILNYLGLKENEVILKLLRQQGSGRRYWRLISEDQTWVWCVYNRDRRENGTFASLSDFLEKLGLNVPHVYLHLVDSGEILMADLGDTCLLEVNHSEETERLLRVVLEQIACLHVEGTRQARLLEVPLQNGFTKGLYDWERDYFREYFLNRLLKEPWLWFPVAEEYQLWRTRLLYQPLCVLHRDLQSANIMVSENKPYLIDFQGMRPGCSCYDVASLLFDPYRCYPAGLREKLWNFYCDRVDRLHSQPPESNIFYTAACQRLLQVIGAFSKLWLEDDLLWYRQFILPGLSLLKEAAAGAGYANLVSLTEMAQEKAIRVLSRG